MCQEGLLGCQEAVHAKEGKNNSSRSGGTMAGAAHRAVLHFFFINQGLFMGQEVIYGPGGVLWARRLFICQEVIYVPGGYSWARTLLMGKKGLITFVSGSSGDHDWCCAS